MRKINEYRAKKLMEKLKKNGIIKYTWLIQKKTGKEEQRNKKQMTKMENIYQV